MKLAVGTVKFGTNYGLINKKKIYLNEIKKISKFINSKINNISLITFFIVIILIYNKVN